MRYDGTPARVEAAFSNPNAFFKLGVAHACGRDACMDLIAAHKWFNIAATLGHVEARLKRADLAAELSGREIAEAQRQARNWFSSRHIALPGETSLLTHPELPVSAEAPKADVIVLARRRAGKPKASSRPKAPPRTGTLVKVKPERQSKRVSRQKCQHSNQGMFFAGSVPKRRGVSNR